MDKNHAIEDDYTPVKVYFRGQNHTAAAEWFLKRFQDGDFDAVMADMLARDGHRVTNTDIDFEGRGMTIVVEADADAKAA